MQGRNTALHCSVLLLSLLAGLAQAASPAAVLQPHGRTELPGYEGDFDHFGVDVKGNRLFLAAEDHGTLEVFELSSGRHLKTVAGVEAPHGVLYLQDANRLVVTDSGAGATKVFDATSYKLIDSIKLAPGADSMAYDPAGRHMYIVAGGKNGNLPVSTLYRVDPRSGKTAGQLQFDTDKVEAMAIEENGARMYVNVTGKNQVAVLDKATLAPLETWTMTAGQANAAMAFDETGHRLFVVTRKPYKLVVLNARTGAMIASLPAPERTNEAIYDSLNHRIYLAGDDFLAVVEQKDADHYEALTPVPTAHGAKTAVLVPQLKKLYAAVSPGEGKTGAAVIGFDVAPQK